MLKEITIQLTDRCNLSCPYCFAPKNFRKDLSKNNLDQFTSFCLKDLPECIHITGGEPSLHDNFVDILALLSEIAPLVVYSNLVKKDTFFSAEKLHGKDIFFLVNLNERNFYSNLEWNNLESNIKKALELNLKIAIGHTFYKSNIKEEFEETLKFIEKYKISHFRISQALQCVNSEHGLSKDNIQLLYQFVANNIENWKHNGIKAYFDCPVPFCYITDEIVSRLIAYGAIAKHCNPKAFVQSDLFVTHCYSTMQNSYKKKINEFQSIKEIREFTSAVIKNIVNRDDIKCKSCVHFVEGKICGCPYYSI